MRLSRLKEITPKAFAWLVMAGIMVLVLDHDFGVFDHIGAERPGAFIEKADYSASIWVKARQNPQGPTYHLRAEIVRTDREYALIALHFPNGGFATFEEAANDEPLQLGKWNSIRDDRGEPWEINMTPSKKDDTARVGGAP